MDAPQILDQYEVEAVGDCRLTSHGDFLAPPRVYTVRGLRSGARYRLKLPKRIGWKVGEIVRLTPHILELNAS